MTQEVEHFQDIRVPEFTSYCVYRYFWLVVCFRFEIVTTRCPIGAVILRVSASTKDCLCCYVCMRADATDHGPEGIISGGNLICSITSLASTRRGEGICSFFLDRRYLPVRYVRYASHHVESCGVMMLNTFPFKHMYFAGDLSSDTYFIGTKSGKEKPQITFF